MRTCVTLGTLLALAGHATAQIDWVDAMPLNSTAWTDATSFGDYYPDLTHDGAGNWVAVWCAAHAASSARDFEIYVSRSSNDGVTWSAPELLDSYASQPAEIEDDFHPHVFYNGAGDWLTAWYTHDTRGGTLGSDTDLLVSHSGDLGATWTPSSVLNTDATTDQIPTNYASDSSPTIAVDPNGLWIAVWSRKLVSGGESDLYIAHSSDNGATWTAPAILTPEMTADDGDDHSPVLVTDNAGGWMLAWTSSSTLSGTLGSDNDLLFSTSVDGYNWSTPAPLNDDAATDGDMNQKSTDLAYDGSGRWLAMWHEGIYNVVEDDVVYAYSDDFGVTWSESSHLTLNDLQNPARDRGPSIATDGTGRWVAVWYGRNSYGWPTGADDDLFYAVSQDNGLTWSYPDLLNHFAINLFDWQHDWYPEIAATAGGRWVVVWQSKFDLDGIGTDWDIVYTTACMPTSFGDVHCDGAADLRDVSDMQLNFTADATDPWFAPYDLDDDDVITFADVDLQIANLTGPN